MILYKAMDAESFIERIFTENITLDFDNNNLYCIFALNMTSYKIYTFCPINCHCVRILYIGTIFEQYIYITNTTNILTNWHDRLTVL